MLLQLGQFNSCQALHSNIIHQKYQDVLLHPVPFSQYGRPHAFPAILTQDPLRNGRYVTYITVCHANLNKAKRAHA